MFDSVSMTPPSLNHSQWLAGLGDNLDIPNLRRRLSGFVVVWHGIVSARRPTANRRTAMPILLAAFLRSVGGDDSDRTAAANAAFPLVGPSTGLF